jgi:putative redox protein
MKSRVTLEEAMHFVGELEGFEIPVDAGAKHGGSGRGPQPKGLTLTSLAGCTAIDVISLLRKMRAEPDGFWVEADAELSDETPKVFEKTAA